MVARQKYLGVTLVGTPGVGKTYTVLETLKDAEYTDIDQFNESEDDPESGKFYKYIKGKTTPLGVYQTLETHFDKLVIFDDCDTSFNHPDAANIIKAATDDKKSRRINWNKNNPFGLSQGFRFIGSVMIISNLAEMPLAIHDRSLPIKLELTPVEIMTRIREIAALPTFEPAYDDAEKNACIEFIEREVQHNSKLEFSLRVLSSALCAYRNCPENWQNHVHAKMTGG